MNVGQSVFRAIADFSAVRREAASTRRSLNDLADDATVAGSRGGKALVTGFLKAMAKMTIMAPMILALGASLLSAVGSLVSFGASLGAIGGAALPLVGILAGVGIAAGVLKAVLSDFADVMPDVVERFGFLQDALSNDFWGIAAGPMRDMINAVFPAMEAGLLGVSTAWGEIAAEGSRTLGMMLMVNGNMTSMLDNTTAGLREANPGIQAFIKGIVTLGTFGASYLPAVGRWITEIGLRFNAFIQIANSDGSLARWTELGLAALRDLFSVIGSVFGIFGALNTAAQSGGATASLSGLADALNRIQTIMEGPVFQTQMATIFAGAAAGAAAFHNGVSNLFGALGGMAPVLATVLQLSGEISGMLLTGLGPALANPAFTGGFITFLQGAKDGMATLVPLLPGLTTAIGSLLTNLAPLAEVTMPLYVEVITLLATAISALLPIIVPLIEMLAEHPAVLAAVVGGFMLLSTAATAFGAAANIVSMGMKLWTAATTIGTTVMKGFRAVMATAFGPIGLIITGIALLVAGLIWFFTQTELGQAIVTNVWNGIKAAVGAVADWFTGTFVPALVGVWESIKSAWSSVGDFFASLWAGAVAIFQSAVDGIKSGWSSVTGFFQTIGDGIKSGFGTVKQFFIDVFNTVAAAVQVFVNGFVAGWNWLMGVLAPIFALIANLFQMWVAIFQFVAALIDFVIDAVILTFMKLWAQAVAIFGAISAFLSAIWGVIVAGVTLAWNFIVGIIVGVLTTIWERVSSVWNTVVAFLTSVMDGIIAFVTAAWNSIRDAVVNAATSLWEKISAVWNMISTMIAAVGGIIWGSVSWLWNTVSGFISGVMSTIWGYVSTAWNNMVDAVKGPAQRIWDAISEAFTNVVDFVAGIPGKILGALGDLGGMLWNAGKQILQGLLDGLNSMIDSVTGFFTDLTSKIPDLKGPLPVDKVLLKGAGLAIMDGFLNALESRYDPVRDSLAGFTNSLAADVPLAFNAAATLDPAGALSGWDAAYVRELAPEINSRTTMNESPGDNYHVDKLEVNNPLPEPASESLPNAIRTLSTVGVKKR